MAAMKPHSIDATTPARQLDAKRAPEAAPLALAGTAGVLGSLCCVGPLAAVSFGLGGGVASALVAFAPYRPIFVLLALGALAWSGWRIYRRPAAACAADSACAAPATQRTMKVAFWIVASAVLLLLAFPYYGALLLD